MASREETIKLDESPPAGAGELRAIVLLDGSVRTHALPVVGSVVIGRASDSEIVVDDPSMSRHHARLHVAESLAIEDLGSANGTFVHGERIHPGAAVPVDVGDLVELGGATLVLQGRPQRASDTGAERSSDAMESMRHLVHLVAKSSLSILLLGETGVGKGVLAAEIHRVSRRADKPFLELNCAAMPESLLESELFGFERGAFTGALRTKPGLLEAASGGTVLLDEIGETPLSTQAKLLRAIEQREVLRLGALEPQPVDVRFISATNRDLAAEVERGAFRKDLYFRLNGISVEIPPLRERVAEIESLANQFLDEASAASGQRATFSREAMSLLRRQPWPGNIRELRNVVERAAALRGDSGVIGVEHLALDTVRASRPPRAPASRSAPPGSDDAERRRVLDTLARFAGNQSRAAEALGMARRTLILRLEAYGVPRPRKGRSK
jgi:transcriptional regulator with PAS, ATPase and Fis domain